MGTTLREYFDEYTSTASPEELEKIEELRAHYTRAAQLLARRKAIGLTQAELAARSHVDQAEVSRLERGVGNPTEATLERVASALNARWELVGEQTDSRPAMV